MEQRQQPRSPLGSIASTAFLYSACKSSGVNSFRPLPQREQRQIPEQCEITGDRGKPSSAAVSKDKGRAAIFGRSIHESLQIAAKHDDSFQLARRRRWFVLVFVGLGGQNPPPES